MDDDPANLHRSANFHAHSLSIRCFCTYLVSNRFAVCLFGLSESGQCNASTAHGCHYYCSLLSLYGTQTAAWVITNSGKLERHLSYSLRQELHWLDVPERIQFRVAATVYRCLHNMAPQYLSEMCMPIATSARHQGLRTATSSDLVIPRVRRTTFGSRAFSVAGPVCWNGLPDYLKSPDLSFDCFKRQLKIFLISILCILGCIRYFSMLETTVDYTL